MLQLITDRTGQEQYCAARYRPLATVWMGSVAHRRRLEMRPFGCSSSKPPGVIRQRPLPPNSALLDEIRERRLTKCIGHWARKVPAAGVGRSRWFDPPPVAAAIRPWVPNRFNLRPAQGQPFAKGRVSLLSVTPPGGTHPSSHPSSALRLGDTWRTAATHWISNSLVSHGRFDTACNVVTRNPSGYLSARFREPTCCLGWRLQFFLRASAGLVPGLLPESVPESSFCPSRSTGINCCHCT
jgi:hypothetical protein